MADPESGVAAMTSIASLVLASTTALAALAAPAALAFVPADPAFLGTWMLDASESEFGMSPAPDSAMTVFTRADDRLVMTRKVWTSMGGGHRTVEFDQAIDGEAGIGISSRGDDIPSRAWWEGDVLVLEVEVESNMGAIIVTDRMFLMDDDTLVLERVMDVPSMGEMEQTIVYRRR
jgi:hypothetical protein